ncbi:hypothetical protein GC175_17430 [bacterium]|nr:hypothetical protein [bacterium]
MAPSPAAVVPASQAICTWSAAQDLYNCKDIAGIYTKNSDGKTTLYAIFNNSGLLQAQTVTIALQAGSNSGTINIETGATVDIDFGGSFENTVDGTIQDTGVLETTGANFINNGTIADTVIVIN